MLIYLALISCARAKAEQTFELHREQNTIFFKGKIENASARALIDQIHSGISLIVISSEGGSVMHWK
jgi:phosphoribosylpyrophosphate synthetase